jgi:hypothetical protein
MKYPVQMAGLDWKSIFQSIPAATTARAWQVALTPIAGSPPVVTDHGTYWSVRFTPEQEERVSAWILTQLRREPGPVRVEASGIALRVVGQQYWPYALGLVGLGVGLAYLLRKG